MTQEQWSKVDDYLNGIYASDDAALEAAVAAGKAAGLPDMAVSTSQGRLLHILAKSVRASRALEIGTLGGYSAIWIARALAEGGRLISLEREPRFAAVATSNLAQAGLEGKVEVRIGDALDLLPQLAADGSSFDFTFVDADKVKIAEYFDWAVTLSRPGALIVVDNVIRAGRVIDAQTADPSVRGVRRFNSQLGSDRRVLATTIQTVGAKGYDGFTIAMVVGGAHGLGM